MMLERGPGEIWKGTTAGCRICEIREGWMRLTALWLCGSAAHMAWTGSKGRHAV